MPTAVTSSARRAVLDQLAADLRADELHPAQLGRLVLVFQDLKSLFAKDLRCVWFFSTCMRISTSREEPKFCTSAL